MSNRVYIGRLSSRASERDIEHFFRGYGRLRDIILKNGFGFVVSNFLNLRFRSLGLATTKESLHTTCALTREVRQVTRSFWQTKRRVFSYGSKEPKTAFKFF